MCTIRVDQMSYGLNKTLQMCSVKIESGLGYKSSQVRVQVQQKCTKVRTRVQVRTRVLQVCFSSDYSRIDLVLHRPSKGEPAEIAGVRPHELPVTEPTVSKHRSNLLPRQSDAYEINTFMGQQGEADRETDKQINQHAVFTYSMIQGCRSGFF